jgi:hypothetical protein
VVAASAATVEVAIAEKKEDEIGLQEREGVAVAAWSWYLWRCIGWVCWYSHWRRQLWRGGESCKRLTGKEGK